MKQIREWLGHSDISTTANIYAHLDSRSKQLSAATMEQTLALPEELPKAGGKMGKRNPRGKPLGFWRSIRDLNSGGAVNALSHFECDLFDLLSNAPYEIVRQARRVGYRRSPTTPYYTKKFPARQEKFDAPGFLFFYNFAMPLAVAGMDCITPGGNGAVGVIEIGIGPGVEYFGLSVAAHGAAHRCVGRRGRAVFCRGGIARRIARHRKAAVPGGAGDLAVDFVPADMSGWGGADLGFDRNAGEGDQTENRLSGRTSKRRLWRRTKIWPPISNASIESGAAWASCA